MKNNTQSIARKWFEKADDDLKTAQNEIELGGAPWVIAFHCQQAIEKYLKGYQTLEGISPRKIHDLVPLARALPEKNLQEYEDGLIELSKYYIVARYPLDIDEGISTSTAKKLYQTAQNIIEILKKINNSHDKKL